MSASPAAGSQAEPNATAQAATTSDDDKAQAVESISLDEAKKLRSEAQSLRNRLKAFEKAEEERKQATLSEVEKREARIRELEESLSGHERRARDYALRDAIAATVARDDFPATPVAASERLIRLLDPDAIEWDGATPKNVPALLGKLVQSDPYLFAAKPRRPGGGDAGGVQTAPSGVDMNSLIRRAGGRQ